MKVTINGWVFVQQYEWENKPRFSFFDFEGASDWIKLCAAEVSVEVADDFDIRPLKIEALRKELVDLNANFQARVTELNAQIQSLLAIEA